MMLNETLCSSSSQCDLKVCQISWPQSMLRLSWTLRCGLLLNEQSLKNYFAKFVHTHFWSENFFFPLKKTLSWWSMHGLDWKGVQREWILLTATLDSHSSLTFERRREQAVVECIPDPRHSACLPSKQVIRWYQGNGHQQLHIRNYEKQEIICPRSLNYYIKEMEWNQIFLSWLKEGAHCSHNTLEIALQPVSPTETGVHILSNNGLGIEP